MSNPRREAKRARSQEARRQREREARRRRSVKVVAIIAAVAIGFTGVGSFIGATGNSDDNEQAVTSSTTPTTAAPTPVEPTCPPVDGSAERQIAFTEAPPTCIDPERNYQAVFDTTEGIVRVDLNTERTPNTTNNFVFLARYGYYDGTEIFRTDPSIDIIQGGSPRTNDNSDPGPGYTIEDESDGFTYTEGDLVMARTQAPDSASGQYFFATGPAVSGLDAQGSYVTFGRTTEGLDVLKTIIGLNQSGESSPPSRTVTLNSVTIEES